MSILLISTELPKKKSGVFDSSAAAADDTPADGNEVAVDGAAEGEQALVSNDAALPEDLAMSDDEDAIVTVPEE